MFAWDFGEVSRIIGLRVWHRRGCFAYTVMAKLGVARGGGGGGRSSWRSSSSRSHSYSPKSHYHRNMSNRTQKNCKDVLANSDCHTIEQRGIILIISGV